MVCCYCCSALKQHQLLQMWLGCTKLKNFGLIPSLQLWKKWDPVANYILTMTNLGFNIHWLSLIRSVPKTELPLDDCCSVQTNLKFNSNIVGKASSESKIKFLEDYEGTLEYYSSTSIRSYLKQIRGIEHKIDYAFSEVRMQKLMNGWCYCWRSLQMIWRST